MLKVRRLANETGRMWATSWVTQKAPQTALTLVRSWEPPLGTNLVQPSATQMAPRLVQRLVTRWDSLWVPQTVRR